MNIYYGLFTIFIGISMTTSIFVGNAIGEGNVEVAK
jgi:Na+-driven multidrug efflux pump